MEPRQRIITGATVLLLATGGSASAASIIDEAGIGYVFKADVDDFDNGTAIAIRGSKKLDAVAEGFSVEAEFTKSLSAPDRNWWSKSGTYKDTGEVVSASQESELTYFTAGIFGKYTFQVNRQLSLFGRGGFAYIRTETSLKTSCSGSQSFCTQLNSLAGGANQKKMILKPD